MMTLLVINERAQDMFGLSRSTTNRSVKSARKRLAARCVLPAFAMIAAAACDGAPLLNGSTPLTTDNVGHYTAAVTLNGQGPFQFIVDTGSQSSDLSSNVAAQLRLQSGRKARMTGASGDELSATVVVCDYRSDLFDRHDEPMLLIPNSSLSNADGVLGMDAFSSSRIEFDFVARQLTVGPSASGSANFVVQPGAVRLGNFMIVDVVIDGVHANAMIDTGGKQTVGNPQLQAALGFKSDDARLLPDHSIKGVTMQQTPAWKTTLETLSIGEMTFAEPTVTFAELPVFHTLGLDDGPAMIIGIDQLSSLQGMAIDYPRAELQLR